MSKLESTLLAIAVCLSTGGCAGISTPNWLHPGTSASQVARAERFDPFPEDEPGPKIVGGRPRNFEKPPAEPLRARWLPWNWGG